ncbi:MULTISPECIES: carbohydrate ABC transporter permease [unclassified Curtobacterium]|uniref:carbohydrate ABC transporter permease n=1 Tax=unclassified Curtobacterium TaxID=257496 RepID=UPI000DA8CD2F|nr:carbohydrate ABC transporter permease [Curtobacterium sp. MCBD17_028]PZF62760.1 carbohydrate ABC transporter permease [Curtobacterium sp. MCBD17_013]
MTATIGTSTTPATAPAPPSARRTRRSPVRWLLLAVAVLVGVVLAAPFLVLILNAFKTRADYSANGPFAWPEQFTTAAFAKYLADVDFPVALVNSILISGIVAILGVVIALLAAYAIGIGRIRGGTVITAVLLFSTMLPQESIIYPLFYGAQAVGLQGSIWSVIIIFSVLQAAFGTYLLGSIMGTFEPSLLEAAALDGANRWQILWRVVFPVMRPTLSVLVIFFFIWTWNEFYIPVIMLTDPSAQTIPIALSTLQGQLSTDITEQNAGSLLSLLPTLIFFIIFQRSLTRGITAGAVK